jgi:hypothetical protein
MTTLFDIKLILFFNKKTMNEKIAQFPTDYTPERKRKTLQFDILALNDEIEGLKNSKNFKEGILAGISKGPMWAQNQQKTTDQMNLEDEIEAINEKLDRAQKDLKAKKLELNNLTGHK